MTRTFCDNCGTEIPPRSLRIDVNVLKADGSSLSQTFHSAACLRQKMTDTAAT